MNSGLDSQQVELIARASLESRLLRLDRIEIARPNRDKGVDLLIYLDEPDKPFAAVPLQLKASSGEGFGVYRKYEGMAGLIHVYVWHALTDSPRFFFLTYSEAEELVPQSSKTRSSWTREDGLAYWRWPEAPAHVKEKLQPYENRWQWLREQLEAARGQVIRSCVP